VYDGERETNLPELKTYKLYLSLVVKLMIFGMLGLFTIVGLLLVSGVFPSAEGHGPPRFFGILWLGMVGWYWYWILSFPHKITASETGEIIFISLLRRRTVFGAEIESIKPDRAQFGFLVVRTANRKIRLLNQFDGFHDFIINLKAMNPTVELRGC
jgi:hypothetical protein